MIKKFEEFKLITENPDHVYDKEKHDNYTLSDKDATPFTCFINSDHTKIIEIDFGETGEYHDISISGSYPGRLWTNSRVISFWVYPNIVLFKDIIKNIEDELNIKIFNNGWKIEVIKDNDGIITTEYDDKKAEYYSNNVDYNDSVLVSVEEYAGSKDVPEEQKLWHLMNAKEKEKAIKMGKRPEIIGGSHLTGWDQKNNIRWRQALRQENNKFKN